MARPRSCGRSRAMRRGCSSSRSPPDSAAMTSRSFSTPRRGRACSATPSAAHATCAGGRGSRTERAQPHRAVQQGTPVIRAREHDLRRASLIFVEGPAGSGREMLARWMHELRTGPDEPGHWSILHTGGGYPPVQLRASLFGAAGQPGKLRRPAGASSSWTRSMGARSSRTR